MENDFDALETCLISLQSIMPPTDLSLCTDTHSGTGESELPRLDLINR